MSKVVFVDTSAWFASIVPTDPNHAAARGWLASTDSYLFTSDYIVDETLTLLRMRGEKKRALELGERFFDQELTEVYRLSEDDLFATWETFRRFQDKNWSFTDCSSKVVIEKMNIGGAFAFDRHFHQFGAINIFPS